ncbi:class I SAM-dependent methyltransferase [Sphingomonas sp. Leaf20]|uniref:class I SAM-dependent methyltransferase n=1 Tax=Sphingomonas sp. Leaf20 TaxID=1735685 RepID=UPI0006F9E6F1|nr:class I SAM-dependent methyltransferase [Sphingomonas sp. Leaf20]KQM72017.1 hypothetical protein ASE72_11125 [Sphingomonas sp. Leaf20]
MTEAYDWTNRVGDIWASEWVRTDRSFAGLSRHLDAAVVVATGTDTRTIVDIGCGAGGTSLAIARAIRTAVPRARIVGIDLSSRLIEIARSRVPADDDSGRLVFTCGDVAAAIDDWAPVDLYMSRHGVMFFADPVASFAALARAAAPGATLIFSCFADRAANRWATETTATGGDDDGASGAPVSTAPGPFAFADPDHVDAILTRAGWQTTSPHYVEFAYRAGEGADPVADAVAYFRRIGPAASWIRDAPDDERAARIAHLVTACERYRVGDVVEFPAAAWIWTAHKPVAPCESTTS